MNISDAFKENNLAVWSGDKCLYFDEVRYEWVVALKKKGQRELVELLNVPSICEEEAVSFFLQD